MSDAQCKRVASNALEFMSRYGQQYKWTPADAEKYASNVVGKVGENVCAGSLTGVKPEAPKKKSVNVGHAANGKLKSIVGGKAAVSAGRAAPKPAPKPAPKADAQKANPNDKTVTGESNVAKALDRGINRGTEERKPKSPNMPGTSTAAQATRVPNAKVEIKSNH